MLTPPFQRAMRGERPKVVAALPDGPYAFIVFYDDGMMAHGSQVDATSLKWTALTGPDYDALFSETVSRDTLEPGAPHDVLKVGTWAVRERGERWWCACKLAIEAYHPASEAACVRCGFGRPADD
jgi:hypothetical protein